MDQRWQMMLAQCDCMLIGPTLAPHVGPTFVQYRIWHRLVLAQQWANMLHKTNVGPMFGQPWPNITLSFPMVCQVGLI